MLKKWRQQRKCMHHKLPGFEKIGETQTWVLTTSYINSMLIDTGTRKMFW